MSPAEFAQRVVKFKHLEFSGIYFAIEMAIVTASCVQSVIVLNLFYHGTTGRHVPRWMKTILFDYLGKLLCFESKERRLHDEYIYMEKKKHVRIYFLHFWYVTMPMPEIVWFSQNLGKIMNFPRNFSKILSQITFCFENFLLSMRFLAKENKKRIDKNKK